MTICPRCSSHKIVHYWRTDMRTLKWVDDYKCLDCTERWVTTSAPKSLPIEK